MNRVLVADRVAEHITAATNSEDVDTGPYATKTSAKWLALAMLMIGAVTLYLNQQILSVLILPIQSDLNLNDTQISLLIGFAFVGTFALAGFPLGRMVDRVNRFKLIAAGIIIWSVTTALCGVANSFWQLFVLRMAVGIGEAVLGPAAYSLMPDLFPPRRLGLTISLFTVSLLVGGGLAMAVGGNIMGALAAYDHIDVPLLGAMESWRVTLLVVGVPSTLVGVWAFLTPEPPRRGTFVNQQPAVSEVMRYLRANTGAIANLIVSWGFLAVTILSMAAWTPTFLIRTYGWTTQEAGVSYGITLVISAMGAILGGALSDRAAVARPNGRLVMMMSAATMTVPIFALLSLAGSGTSALMFIGSAGFLINVAAAAFPPALQEAVPNRMRGLSSGIALATATFIGYSVGPTAVALVTDYVLKDPALIGMSLSIVLPIAVLISVGFAYRSGKNYANAHENAMQWVPERVADSVPRRSPPV
uniref:Putative MFS type transporter n=1 Tax=Sphingomonas sp. KSM1 TaxID=1228049 RepID=M1VB82_9SPHN|nr:putative MFS type transporter [Sphingomonas sp. KSM1]